MSYQAKLVAGKQRVLPQKFAFLDRFLDEYVDLIKTIVFDIAPQTLLKFAPPARIRFPVETRKVKSSLISLIQD